MRCPHSSLNPRNQSPSRYRNPRGSRGGRWNTAPDEAVRSNPLTPEKQLGRKNGWKSFATGGVVDDDERREKLLQSNSMTIACANELNELSRNATSLQPPPPPVFNVQRGDATSLNTPAIRNETVTSMGDGRNRFTHEYLPEVAREGGFQRGSNMASQSDGIISDLNRETLGTNLGGPAGIGRSYQGSTNSQPAGKGNQLRAMQSEDKSSSLLATGGKGGGSAIEDLADFG